MNPEPTSTEATQDSARIEQRLRLEAQHKNGAAWFYWIAGLSLINSIAAFAGSTWGFIFGLAVTQVVDALATSVGGSVATVAALVIDVFIAGVLVFVGIFARKGHVWAYWLGMVLYALDGLVSLIATYWLGVAFHAFALYSIYQGLSAHRQLSALASSPGAQAAEVRTVG
ncbi:MAG: hypothetical protein ACRD24_02135 [Terriglobales bacterium]